MKKNKKKDKRPKILKELDSMSDEEVIKNKDRLIKKSRLFSVGGLGLIIAFVLLMMVASALNNM